VQALPIHPRTGLRALGWTRRGPIWPVMGGSEPPADPPADPPPDPPAPEPTPLEQQASAAIDELRKAGAQIPDALAAAVKEFRDARKEAADHRGKTKAERDRADAAEAKLGEILKAAGLEPGDEPKPDELKSRLDASDGQLRQARIELAAYKSAGKHGANPDALLDSATFLKKLSGLDPDKDGFDADLESAIKAAVEANSTLKALPGGGQARGPAQGPRQTPKSRPRTLEEAAQARYS
jgi:hypothetical protein